MLAWRPLVSFSMHLWRGATPYDNSESRPDVISCLGPSRVFGTEGNFVPLVQALALDRSNVAALDATWHHGWCKECYHIKPAIEKVRISRQQPQQPHVPLPRRWHETSGFAVVTH